MRSLACLAPLALTLLLAACGDGESPLPPDARLLLDGVPVVPGQVISIADLNAGKLVLHAALFGEDGVGYDRCLLIE